MSEPVNSSPSVASAEEVVLHILKNDATLKNLKDFDPAKNVYPDLALVNAMGTPPKLYCAYKRVTTRAKSRIGALSAGGPEWVTLEYLCCCAEGDAKRGQSRVLADAVTKAIEAVNYPARILDRTVPSIKAREARQDLMAQSPEGEMLPDRVVRLEIGVKLN